MHTAIRYIGLSALVRAATATSCCFNLNATGGPGGEVGQLSDGQNRIGQGLPEAKYCIDSGEITDGSGRGCILTPPTTQFQCDTGATPTSGFSIACDGTLEYNDSSKFVACPTGDNGGYNIYTVAPSGQQGCVDITLEADSCMASCPAAPSSTSCPEALTGNWEYPHLIVPISSSSPSTAAGTSYDGTVSSTVSSIFDFDIPSSDAGKTCSLVFLFPTQAQLETSSFTMSGPGTVDIACLTSPATESTTWNNAPSVATDYGTMTLTPGSDNLIATFPCPAGERVGFEISSVGGTDLTWFQDYNPSPIGLYITVC